MRIKQTLHIVTVALAACVAMGCEDHSAHQASAAEGTAAAVTDGRVAVEVGARGYTPNRVQATAGKPLTLVFTRTTDKGCGDKLVIASHDIQRDLPLNEPVEVTFTPKETGELTFTCGMGMYDGKVVVQ
jgi:plastocyanin domain-containing protein